MKKIVTHLLLAVATVVMVAPLRAQEIPTRSVIKHITLFLNGAQVKRQATAQVKAGSNLLVITDLPSTIDAKSIKLEGQNGITLVSVNTRFNYLKKAPQNPYYKQLSQERKELKRTLQRYTNDKSILDEEYKMLMSNQSIKGENQTLNAERLMDYSEAFEDRLTDINIKRQELDRKSAEGNKRLTALNNQIREIEQKENRNTLELVINLSSASAKKANLEFSYSTTSARWVPFYDIRSIENGAPIQIGLKAKVAQWTGEEWNDVNLTLSTGNPSENHALPRLNTWNLSVHTISDLKKKGKGSYSWSTGNAAPVQSYQINDISNEESVSELKQEAEKSRPRMNTPARTTVIQTKEISTEYQIQEKYSIPTDAKDYDVDITALENPAIYSYYTAPKAAKGAYMLARLPEWQKLNLLNGEANVYFNKTYIGRTHLTSELFSDTLDVSMGRDPNVIVDRQRVKAQGSTQIAGNTRTDTYIYEISMKNNKSTAIDLTIEDVYPISQDKDILVKLLEDGDAKVDAVKGKLTWRNMLKPGESKKLRFSYSVKYPKARRVYGY